MKKKEILIITIGIAIAIVILFGTFWILFNNSPKQDELILAKVYFSVEKNDGNYNITITKTMSGTKYAPSKEEHWKIENFEVWLINSSKGYGEIFGVHLIYILNNETSNLTYYDIDENGRVSIGDKFVVKGNLAEKYDTLELLYDFASDIGNIYFK